MFQEKAEGRETLKMLAQAWVALVVLAVGIGLVMVLGAVPAEVWKVVGLLLEKGWNFLMGLETGWKLVLGSVLVMALLGRVTRWAMAQLARG